jgi:hypothetical protein
MGILHRRRDREAAAKAIVTDWLINATAKPSPAEDQRNEAASPVRPKRPLRARAGTGD